MAVLRVGDRIPARRRCVARPQKLGSDERQGPDPINPITGAGSVRYSVTFSETVNASGSAFLIECPAGTSRAFAQSSSPATSFTLNPNLDLPYATTCSVTTSATQITDTDGTADQMAANHTFTFTTAAAPVDGNGAPSVTTR